MRLIFGERAMYMSKWKRWGFTLCITTGVVCALQTVALLYIPRFFIEDEGTREALMGHGVFLLAMTLVLAGFATAISRSQDIVVPILVASGVAYVGMSLIPMSDIWVDPPFVERLLLEDALEPIFFLALVVNIALLAYVRSHD